MANTLVDAGKSFEKKVKSFASKLTNLVEVKEIRPIEDMTVDLKNFDKILEPYITEEDGEAKNFAGLSQELKALEKAAKTTKCELLTMHSIDWGVVKAVGELKEICANIYWALDCYAMTEDTPFVAQQVTSHRPDKRANISSYFVIPTDENMERVRDEAKGKAGAQLRDVFSKYIVLRIMNGYPSYGALVKWWNFPNDSKLERRYKQAKKAH